MQTYSSSFTTAVIEARQLDFIICFAYMLSGRILVIENTCNIPLGLFKGLAPEGAILVPLFIQLITPNVSI